MYTPYLSHGLLYINGTNFSDPIHSDAFITAFDPLTGVTTWQSPAGYYTVFTTSSLNDDSNGPLLARHATTDTWGLAALDRKTGTVLWNVTTCGNQECRPLWYGVVKNTFYQLQWPNFTGGTAATLVSFNAHTGKAFTRHQTDLLLGDNHSTVEGTGTLYARSYRPTNNPQAWQYQIQSINLKNGQVNWTYSMQPGQAAPGPILIGL